jgi:hypothetical protein
LAGVPGGAGGNDRGAGGGIDGFEELRGLAALSSWQRATRKCKAYPGVSNHLEWKRLDERKEGNMTEKQKRDKAVDEFAAEMKARLDWAADEKRYTGWDGAYSEDHLRTEMLADAEDITLFNNNTPKKFFDVANRCMFLWYRNTP